MVSVLPGGGGKAAPPKQARGHGGNAHYMVNLDTGHHLPHPNSLPVRTTAREKALIGPDTIIAAAKMGHLPMTYAEHTRQRTNVHKHLNGRVKHPHPAAMMTAPAMQREMASMLPGRAG